MYLRLTHGRLDPEQDMDKFGSEGSIFKIEDVQFTYGTINRVRFEGSKDYVEFQTDKEYDDLVFYDGIFYGDIFIHNEFPNLGGEVVTFDPKKMNR